MNNPLADLLRLELRGLLFSLVLWGEPPEVAEQHRTDWQSYLFDYEQEHSRIDTCGVTLRACVAHIWWRVTARSGLSTVPALMTMGFFTLAMAYLGAVDPIASTVYADAHSTLAGMFIVTSFLRAPSRLDHSRLLSIALILCGTAAAHQALVLDTNLTAYNVMATGLGLVCVGAVGTGLSALKTQTPLGVYVQLWSITGVGTFVMAISNLFLASTTTSARTMLALQLLAFAELALIPQFINIWRLGQMTMESEHHRSTAKTHTVDLPNA